MKWFFTPITPNGGAMSDAYLNPLTGSGLTAEGVLGREAIQNSSDALSEEESQVYVRITKRILSPEQVAVIRDKLSVKEMLEARRDKLALPDKCALTKIAGLSDGEIEVLIIEDFNTVGLGGARTSDPDPSDHFMKLVFFLGSSDKIDETDGTSGGSFGYGKSVYSSHSDSRTVAYYSAFDETDRAPGETARFIVASLFKHHRHDDRKFDGRAFWGEPDELEGVRTSAPFTNEAAHEMAAAFGFEAREDEDTGASLMIFGSNVDMAQLRSEIETYYWPKIIDNELIVELFDGDERLSPPAPRKREDLRPFLRCYDFLLGRDTPDHEAGDRTKTFQKMEGKALGSIATVRLSALEEDNEDFDNRVAYVRQAKMVVKYDKLGIDGLPKLAGVFLADEDIDAVLKLSEPPAHNNWDQNSNRLEGDQPEYVKRVIGRIKFYFRQFQKDLAPPEPPASGRMRVLEKMLAKLLPDSGDGPNPPPQPAERDEFQIENSIQRLEDEGGAYLSGGIKIKIRDDADNEKLSISVRPAINILENETCSSSEKLGFELSSQASQVVIAEDAKSAEAEIAKDQFVEIQIESERVDPDWLLELVENIESIESVGSAISGVIDEAH